MRYLRRSLLASLIFTLFSCNLPTGPDPTIHADIIRVEWALAQNKLSEAPDISEDAYKVSWSRFEWRAHEGPFWDCNFEFEGETYPVNGCLSGGTIHWNIATPGVIRHEAVHGILKKLGHFCMRYVSYDGDNVNFHKYVGDSPYCLAWIKSVWGEA